MEFLEPLMGAAAAIAAGAISGSSFTFTSTNTSWQGRGNDATWCRLFVGDRYHASGGMHSAEARQNFLPQPQGQKQTVIIPSANLKDIVSMAEHTRLISTNNGTVTERICDLQCRKIVTSPVNVDNMFKKGCRAMCVQKNRYFIDENNGPMDVSQALKFTINCNSDERELVMNWELLVAFMGFMVAHNDSGGYAVCEVCQLSEKWYAVRQIIILGKEKGSRQQVELHSASISHRLRQGKRYIREYHSATLIGSGRTMDMVTTYRSLGGIQPYTESQVHPTLWKANINSADLTSWKIPCSKTQYSLDENGTITKETKDIFIVVDRPLYGKVLMLEERTSKTGCPKLVCGTSASEMIPSYASPLSLLGAVVQDSNGNSWTKKNTYVRADGIQSVLAALVPKPTVGSCMSATLVSTGRMHSAGKRGSFPIYKLVPVVYIRSKWYNLNTLRPTSYKSPMSANVRYLELGAAVGGDLTEALSDFDQSSSSSM